MATGEDAPVGKIVVLEDTDGDGRWTSAPNFWRPLPRALAGLVAEGVLVAEPPNLWRFLRDTNGDARPIEGAGRDHYRQTAKPNRAQRERFAVGARQLDLHAAKHDASFGSRGASSKCRKTSFRGQWGITQDDAQHILRNNNSSALHVDFVPTQYPARKPEPPPHARQL